MFHNEKEVNHQEILRIINSTGGTVSTGRFRQGIGTLGVLLEQPVASTLEYVDLWDSTTVGHCFGIYGSKLSLDSLFCIMVWYSLSVLCIREQFAL